MIESQACQKVLSVKELEIQLNNLINDKKKMEIMKTNAYNFAQKQFVDTKILEQIIKNIINLDTC